MQRHTLHTYAENALQECHLQVLDFHSSPEGFPWNSLNLVLAEVTGHRGEKRRQRNDLARTKAKLSQSHLLCSTSTWCNHRNAAGELQSQTDHQQDWVPCTESTSPPNLISYLNSSLGDTKRADCLTSVHASRARRNSIVCFERSCKPGRGGVECTNNL